ncbi:MAG TPA: ATP-dependent sacrificial sulfur transferase LarE [Gemmatimonadaceae bacterium]|nr:ATP-dependent sacrificial sulfur transferase LarE [Gemmatimonadaceae bacterium]
MLASKEAELTSWLRRQGSVLVGYSGGVDSAYLACVAAEAVGRERMVAVIGRSASYPAEQWAAARRVAEQFGLVVEEVETDELQDPRYAANPVNRCYFCKRELWGRLVPLARARGLNVVVDGTNADDLSDDRPGALAAREWGVESPLAAVGLTKAEIRELSRARGLPTWDQPSAPCLSSRIPHGTPVTPGRLRQVEVAEAALRAAGVVGDLRVRHHGELARVELAAEQLPVWLEADRRSIVAAAVLGAGYRRVAIDLAGFRSGSLNGQGGLTVLQGPDGWVENAELRARALDEGWAAGFRHVAAELASA